MKIDPSLGGLPAGKSETAAAGERTSAKAASTAKSPPQVDTIQLSALSTQLQALEATLGSGGEFDRTKVEAIKSAIREGRLTVNPEVVADRMLAHTLAMIAKGNR